jgi:hypothetical protein
MRQGEGGMVGSGGWGYGAAERWQNDGTQLVAQ